MTFPKVRPRYFLLLLPLFALLAAAMAGAANVGAGDVPQRLRVRLENQRLRSGDTTKVIVEFLDRNYGQVANDATRTIALGQMSSGSRARSSASGQFNQQKIVVKPGAWSGEASFTSRGAGRLFITANSDGLEAGQALVMITSDKSASLLRKFTSLFETTAYAQEDDPGFEIFPKAATATADGRHRAIFKVSFLEIPTETTTVRISTNLTDGGILYNGQPVGGSSADIRIAAGEDGSGEISILSKKKGDFQVTASVRPSGPEDQARVEFTEPRPAQIIFDADPTTIGSDATDIPLTVRLADDGGFPIDPDRPVPIHFSRATESDHVSFDPESLVLAPGQKAAQVVMRLQQLPLGNELKLLAKTDQGIRVGLKSLVIKSAIEKLQIAGPNEVYCGGEQCEFTVYLTDKDGQHRAADWDRHIDLYVSGGVLSASQLVIPKGERKAVVRYSPAHETGKYVLTASSIGIADGTYPIGVVYEAYVLTIFALLGGLVGGIGRQLKADKSFTHIFPHRKRKGWEWGCVGRLAGSVISAFFLYWLFKLGLSQAFGSPMLPAALDLGTRIIAFLFGGAGGFAGIAVLELFTAWLLPGTKREPAPAQ